MSEPTIAIERPTSILIIDGTNIEQRCQESFGRDDFDLRLLFAKVTAGTDLLHAHYFSAGLGRTAPQEARAAQSARFNVLKTMANTTLHLGRYQTRQMTCKKCGQMFAMYAEKGTDVAVAITLVECAIRGRADQLFLLAGDNDYLPALRFAKAEGVPVVVGFVINPQRPEVDQLMAVADLRQNSSRFIKLDEAFMADCWRPRRTR